MPEYLDFILRLTFFCILHSIFAIPRFKILLQQLIRQQLTWYRFIYNLCSILMFGWVMLAWQSTRVLFVAPGVWSLILHGLQLLILWAGFICLRQTGLSIFLGTDFNPETDRATLVTTGCYSVVRHPLYLLGILFLLLNPVITTRWIALTLVSVPYLIFGALIEERRMLRQFGTNYSNYQQDVPFLIPRTNRQTVSKK